MGIEKTIIEQTLHGYSNGHRLLSFSKKFSDNTWQAFRPAMYNYNITLLYSDE